MVRLARIAVAALALATPAHCTLLLPLPEPADPICGRLEAEQCTASMELVRDLDPAAFAGNPIPVVDHSCGPKQFCRVGFSAIVVLVHPGWTDAADLPAFFIQGWQGPERAMTRDGPLPAHILDLLPTDR